MGRFSKSPRSRMKDLEREVQGMKRDAESLGKEFADRSDRTKAEALDNLREHAKDIGRIRDLKKTIEKPFLRGTKY